MPVSRIAINQPGWVWRSAFGVAGFILALPLLLLVMLALLAAVIVFGVLALAATAMTRVRALLGKDQSGRENVRVVIRQP